MFSFPSFKMVVEAAPDYAVDIPLIWQYIGEIIGRSIGHAKMTEKCDCPFAGAFIGAPTSNMSLLKPVSQCIPEDKSKQLFQYIMRYATEFSVRFSSHVWLGVLLSSSPEKIC
jgi:hypothetical protein